MPTWRIDPPHAAREPYGSGTDLGDLRTHGRAHSVLFWLATGMRVDVHDGAVHLLTPDGEPGEEPVPGDVLDAVERAGWVAVVEDGMFLTEKGLIEIRRWGLRRYTRASWAEMERRFCGRVLR